MMRATGGLALGDTKTTSKFASSAMAKASRVLLTPSCSPVWEINRTSRARILSLTIRSLAMVVHLRVNFREKTKTAWPQRPPLFIKYRTNEPRGLKTWARSGNFCFFSTSTTIQEQPACVKKFVVDVCLDCIDRSCFLRPF